MSVCDTSNKKFLPFLLLLVIQIFWIYYNYFFFNTFLNLCKLFFKRNFFIENIFNNYTLKGNSYNILIIITLLDRTKIKLYK